MSKTNKIVIVFLAILSIVLIATNITLALISDKKIESGIIQFKQHKLNIEIVGNESIILTPEELNLGANSTRVINISNPQTSTSCVFRMWLEFYVEGEINTEYLTFNVDGNFSQSESGKFYYNSVLNSGGNLNNVNLKFTVANNLSSEYQGKKYTLKLFIESIQSTKGAVLEEWSADYTNEWLDSVYNYLT